MKVKVFQGFPREVERDVNAWLADNPYLSRDDVTVIQTVDSSTSHNPDRYQRVTLTFIYQEPGDPEEMTAGDDPAEVSEMPPAFASFSTSEPDVVESGSRLPDFPGMKR